jgi:hypothetical protein
MKKVLIISYHFPPDAAVGAVRPAKFAKYLPEFGWEPIIYTVKERYYESCDYSRFEPALNNLRIYRANLIPGPLQLYSRLIYKANKTLNNTSHINQYLEGASQNRGSSLKRFLSCMARVPDDMPGWIFNILMGGYRIIKEHRIDVIITSGPPMGTHLGGLLLKHLTHAKWIADFRDPWKSPAWESHRIISSNFADYVDKLLELRVIFAADILVSTSPSLNNYFKSIVRSNKRNKCHIIPNGFDESDFLDLCKSTHVISPKIKITYAGSLAFSHNPEPLFIALHEMIQRGDISKERMEVDLVGECAYWGGLSVQSLINKYDLDPMVRLIGKISFRECLERMVESDALLLFAQGHPWAIPSKVFEYLRLKKPIFVLTEEGDTKKLLQSFQNAFVVDSKNIETIEQSFLALITFIKKGIGVTDLEGKFKQFDRRNLTENLASYLDRD